jgi:hypothetical protein
VCEVADRTHAARPGRQVGVIEQEIDIAHGNELHLSPGGCMSIYCRNSERYSSQRSHDDGCLRQMWLCFNIFEMVIPLVRTADRRV